MDQKTTQHNTRSLNVDKNVLSNIDNGIIILDTNLQILYFNRWLEIHTGLKQEDVLENYLDELFEKINAKTLKRKIKTALRLGTPTFYTAATSKYLIPIKINQIKISNYTHMRQDVSIIPFDNERGLVSLIITDQTNMIHINSQLEKSILKVKELNKELVKERETIDEKVLLLKFDNKHIITNVSQAYVDILECEKELFIGKPIFGHPFLEIKEALKNEILQKMAEEKIFTFELKTETLSKKRLIFEKSLVHEYDVYEKHIGYILFIQNITSSKKVIQQQEKLLVTSRSAAMGEMISMIAHQWRQPLSVINTIMATLRIKQELNILDNSIISLSFAKIEKTVEYLSNTIDDFRDYFKPNKILQEVHVTKAVDKATTFLIDEMKMLEIDYVENIDKDIVIHSYQNELIQCIINILKNSIDAFKEREESEPFFHKKITVHATKESTHLALSYRDNAGGIAPNIIKKIYEPYFSTKAKNGTGLGLYMTKTIIEEQLKGKITISSSQENTEVVIELPYTLKQLKEIS